MSARRIERLPSGRSNVSNHSNNSSRPITAGANRPSTATAGCNSARGPENNRNNGIPPRPNSSRVPQHHSNNNSSRVNSSRDGVNSSRPNTAEPMLYSTRSDESCLSTTEVLLRIQHKEMKALAEKERENLGKLGEYNEYSRPKPSLDQPLRSVFLDPKVNNIPRSKTRSELMKRIKMTGNPHGSYDIDGDGWVSQEDYGIAKRFDFNGNGVLDPHERTIAKRILADEFFKKHAKDIKLYGDRFEKETHSRNVEWLANNYNFERTYNRLKSTERTLTASRSKKIIECMALPDDSLTKYNYYTNKFDTTAWNDFDGIPRSMTPYATSNTQKASARLGMSDSMGAPVGADSMGAPEHHGGSRKRLMFIRKQRVIEGNQSKLDYADSLKPHFNTRRANLITNTEIENGR